MRGFKRRYWSPEYSPTASHGSCICLVVFNIVGVGDCLFNLQPSVVRVELSRHVDVWMGFKVLCFSGNEFGPFWGVYVEEVGVLVVDSACNVD